MDHKKNQGPGNKNLTKVSGHTDAPVQDQAAAMQRTFSAMKKIIVDLYKLKVSKVWKRTGLAWDYHENPSDFTAFEHTHPYRTYDSDGKQLIRSASIAGHYHLITLGEAANPGEAKPILSVSGPMRLTRKKQHGKWVLADEPVNDYDDHTHDWEYIKSSEVEARMTNIEAQKVIAFEAQKGASVPGVAPGGART